MIQKTNAKQDSLIFNIFEKIHYRDAFQVSFNKNTFKNIDDFAKYYFISQPSWLRLISMNMIKIQTVKNNLKKSNLKIDTTIGSWKIFNRNDNEIVFGDSMGFMDYRFSMRLDKSNIDNIEVSTVVKLNSYMGKYYFYLVKLMHTKFVTLSLKSVTKQVKY